MPGYVHCTWPRICGVAESMRAPTRFEDDPRMAEDAGATCKFYRC
jgi:hypothetical protein